MLLSVIIGIKDKDGGRVFRCLSSLNEQLDKEFIVYLIDYGSKRELSLEIKNLSSQFSFCRYYYVESSGLFWNRSHALNVGIRLSDSEYTVTSDIDLIYPPDFIQTLKNHLNPLKEIHFSANDLSRKFSKWDSLFKSSKVFGKVREKTALGLVQCGKTSVLKEIQGFDEFYCIWGAEDEDLNERLQGKGIETKWVKANWPIYHQWHESSGKRSNNIPPRWQEYFVLHKETYKTKLKRNGEKWGNLLSLEDRPALRYIKNRERAVQIHLENEPTQILFYKFENHLKKVPEGTILHFNYSDPFRNSLQDSKLMKFLKTINYTLNLIHSPIMLVSDLIYFNKYQNVSQYRDVIAYFILVNRSRLRDYYLKIDDYNLDFVIVK